MSMTWQQLARTLEPSLTDDQASSLLWNNTCYPFGTIRQVYKHLRGAIRACRNGIRTCELCPNKIESGYTCASCERALEKARNAP